MEVFSPFVTQAYWIWAILALCLSVIEVMTLTLFLIPFIISAFAISIVCYLVPTLDVELQFVFFAIASFILFLLLKNKFRRIGQPKTDIPGLNRRLDRLIGEIVTSQSLLSQDISTGTAQSRDDTIWPVKLADNIQSSSSSPLFLPIGSRLKVVKTEGSILIVEPVLASIAD